MESIRWARELLHGRSETTGGPGIQFEFGTVSGSLKIPIVAIATSFASWAIEATVVASGLLPRIRGLEGVCVW